MKREKTTTRFDWSRNPTREGVHSVYIATPGSYANYGKDITREEMSSSLSTWNEINHLKAKRAMFKTLFFATLASIPFLAVIYNIFSSIIK